MEDLLTTAGLTTAQASTYLFLLEHGESSPPAIAKALTITRSNAYKVLDSLQDLGLAQKSEVRKKFRYRPADPTALASLVAEERNRVIALEQHVSEAMRQLRSKYRKSANGSTIKREYGAAAMVAAYERQASKREPIHFIRTRADVPFLGFEAMDQVRRLANKHRVQRFGIVPDGPENPTTPTIDARTGLRRTWIPAEAYTAPVEWTVSGTELLIQIFDGEGQVIRVQDEHVADAFRQIWQLLDEKVRADKSYSLTSPHAKRAV